MRCLLSLLLVTACGGAAAPRPDLPPSSARLPEEELVTTMLARLGAAAGCPGSGRVWCIAADGWAAGSAPDLPGGDRVLVGVSIGLMRELPDRDLLGTEVMLAALALREGKGLITDVPPESAAEKRLLAAAIGSVGAALRGERERPELAPALARYLATLPAEATYALVREEGAWRMRGKADARLRRVGRAWVAVELPGEGPEGIFVSLFLE
jgi:hypothetical protein